MMKVLISIYFALTFAVSTSQTNDSAPLRKDYGGRLAAPVKIDGEGPFDFLIDSASTSFVLFDHVRDRIALEEPSGSASVISFAGLKAAPKVTLGAVELAGAELRDVAAALLPDWTDFARTPDGLVGVEYFKERIVIFDFLRNELSAVNRSDFLLTDPHWTALDLQAEDFGIASNPLLIVNIDLGDGPAPALIDTGAELSVCNIPAFDHLRTVPSLRDQQQSVSDANGGEIKSFVVYLSRIAIGDVSFNGQSILASDAPFFRSVGFGDRPLCILGLDFLARQAFAIDYSGQRLLLEGPPKSDKVNKRSDRRKSPR